MKTTMVLLKWAVLLVLLPHSTAFRITCSTSPTVALSNHRAYNHGRSPSALQLAARSTPPPQVAARGAVAVVSSLLAVALLAGDAAPAEALLLDCGPGGCAPGTMEAGTPPPAVTVASSERAVEVARALKKKGAVFYGAYWCGFCDRERQALGAEALGAVSYVECDAKGLDAQANKCKEAGIQAYPTWVLMAEGKEQRRVEGALGLDGLERLAGLVSESAPQRAPPITSKSEASSIAVAEQLRERGAVMYGTYWCPYCDVQRQAFGAQAWSVLNSVECDPRGEGAQSQLCGAITGFPTWIIPAPPQGGDEVVISGYKTPQQLASLLQSQPPPAPAAPPPAAAAPAAAADQDCENCKVPAQKGGGVDADNPVQLPFTMQ